MYVVVSTYEGPSLVKLNERALATMNEQEDTYEERFMYMRPHFQFPNIEAGDWVGVSGLYGETHYGVVKNIEYDNRRGWEDAAEEYHIHLVYNNHDIICWPTDLVSHDPTHLFKRINKEIKHDKLRKEIKHEKLRKDMVQITNRFITSITNTVINW